MNQTKVCIAVSSQQYIMIDEQIAFCLLITTQKADDHRRLGPCKTMAQIPFDSSPEGPNERSKCPKHRERGQENFFCWPLKYITRRLCNWNVRVSLKMLQMMHRLACCLPGLENANSVKGWDLWSLTNGILCVCSSSLYCEVLDHSHPLAKKVPKLLLMGPNQRQQQQENGGSFCWDLSIRSPPPSSLVSCEFLFFYNGQNCGVGTTKREWMLAKVVQGRQHIGTFSKIIHNPQNFPTLSIRNQYRSP